MKGRKAESQNHEVQMLFRHELQSSESLLYPYLAGLLCEQAIFISPVITDRAHKATYYLMIKSASQRIVELYVQVQLSQGMDFAPVPAPALILTSPEGVATCLALCNLPSGWV